MRRPGPLAALSLTALALLGCGSSEGSSGEPGSTSPPAGSPATACDPPAHPFLAPNGASNLHVDAYMSDAYAWAGPTSADLDVAQAVVGGECASLTFDAAGRILTICIALTGERKVLVLDPVGLATLAEYDGLPKGGVSTNGFGAGGYFFLDEQGRVVVSTVDRRIVRLAPDLAARTFDVVETMDLGQGPGALAEADGPIESALPDWAGRVWYVTESGAVGFWDDAAKRPRTLRLAGESIGNSFAVDETGGVFVVSDHALYRLDVDASGEPAITWREEYDRGTRKKPGQVNFGSGTTPTLHGDGWVSITDNADPRMHVLVFARGKDHAGARKICDVPVFGEGESATDNSLIGCNRSLVVENNYGYADPTSLTGEKTTTPGFARVDVRADGSGCDVIWTNATEAAPSVVPKLSVATDAVYAYTKDTDGWYFTAIDFASGATRFETKVGDSFNLNNNWAPVSIAKDGAAYVGVLNGLVGLRPK